MVRLRRDLRVRSRRIRKVWRRRKDRRVCGELGVVEGERGSRRGLL